MDIEEMKRQIEDLTKPELLEIREYCDFILLWDRLQEIKKGVPRLFTCEKE